MRRVQHDDRVVSRAPRRRMAKPEEIAGVVALPVSDQASDLAAITVVVDGGMIQQSPGL
jgi:glucose 1-dehydrogenase